MKKYLKKLLVIFLLVFGFAIIVSSIIFYVYKDEITKKILLSVNSYTNGELRLRNIHINFLEHFPNISLSMVQPRFFEHQVSEKDSESKPIFEFSNLYVAFDVMELIQSRIEIIGITAEGGSINIIQRQDSSYNIISVFHANSAEKSLVNKGAKQETRNEAADISVSVEQLSLNEVDIVIDLIPEYQKQVFTINRSRASLKYSVDSIECKLKSSFKIDRIGINELLSIENEDLVTELDFFYNRIDEEINIFRGNIEFRSAQFYADGIIGLKEDGLIDVSFEVNDQELQFTQLFLTAEGINNIKEGDLFLNGKIHGKLDDPLLLPEVECYFGANNLTIQLPNSSESLKNLVIDGYFSSGTNADLSTASLIIDTIAASMVDGYLRCSTVIHNLKTPEIYYSLDASLNLEPISDIFELGPIEHLQGRIRLSDEYRGIVQNDSSWIDSSPDPFLLKLDSVSFVIVDVLEIGMLNGTVSGNFDSLQITNLITEAQNSDFKIDGVVHEISNLIYKKDKPIKTELSIESELFDFPDLFTYLPEVAQSFPYQITNVKLDVELETSRNKLMQFNKVPQLNFKIHEASGTIESFLPYGRLTDGTFDLFEMDSTSILDFRGFDITIANATATADYTLYMNPMALDSMTIKLVGQKMNPAKIFFDPETDSISEIVNAELHGDYFCTIVLPADTAMLFHSLRLNAQDFIYNGIDTISASNIDLRSSKISYDKYSNSNPLATLEAKNELYCNDLETSIFQSENLDLSVNVSSGKYTLIPHNTQQFGEDERGKLELVPFDDPPQFHLGYSIRKLPLHDFLSSFYSEKLFTGFVDLELDLTSSGKDVEEITSNMSGTISLIGDSLTLWGINLDDLINNFRRSQSFNLVDVGAVALAGPAGILYTKGSDYAAMLTAKKGDSTRISKISSNWHLQDGKITIDDVAFATLENRLAAKGWLDMRSDSLDIVIGVVEATGCAIIDQRIYGKGADPEYGKVKVIRTLLSPVTKVLNRIVARDCEVFYDGVVKHPVNQKK